MNEMLAGKYENIFDKSYVVNLSDVQRWMSLQKV